MPACCFRRNKIDKVKGRFWVRKKPQLGFWERLATAARKQSGHKITFPKNFCHFNNNFYSKEFNANR